MKILHLGSGRVGRKLRGADEFDVISLDQDDRLKPDLVCTLGRDPIPLPDDSIDTAVAIHVLEHIGKQGELAEWQFFWEDLYRVLKPGGGLEFLSPKWNSVWAWGDPTHCRALSPESFIFFAQDNYLIDGNPISPYRIKCDFIPAGFSEEANGNFGGVLVAHKPLNPWWTRN
jgi:SAM-dependent methyltransferase